MTVLTEKCGVSYVLLLLFFLREEIFQNKTADSVESIGDREAHILVIKTFEFITLSYILIMYKYSLSGSLNLTFLLMNFISILQTFVCLLILLVIYVTIPFFK